MRAIIVGLISGVLALIGYSLYEYIKNRWIRFKYKDFQNLVTYCNFSEEVSTYLWKNYRGKLGQLLSYNKKGEEVSAGGLEITGLNDNLLAALRENIPNDYLVFIADFDKKNKKIGIIKGYDKYLILKNMQTNGDSYNVSNGKLINELKIIDKTHPFSIIGAGYDWVELEFKSFSEDTVSREELTSLLERFHKLSLPQDISMEKNRIFLWWPPKQKSTQDGEITKK